MELLETTPRTWGNSLGITFPREIVRKEHLSTERKVMVLVIGPEMEKLKKAFGTIKLKKPTQKVMDEIDEGYD